MLLRRLDEGKESNVIFKDYQDKRNFQHRAIGKGRYITKGVSATEEILAYWNPRSPSLTLRPASIWVPLAARVNIAVTAAH